MSHATCPKMAKFATVYVIDISSTMSKLTPSQETRLEVASRIVKKGLVSKVFRQTGLLLATNLSSLDSNLLDDLCWKE